MNPPASGQNIAGTISLERSPARLPASPRRGAQVIGLRGARPARWPTGTPKPPGAAAPGEIRTEAGSEDAARRGGPGGRWRREPRRAARTGGCTGRSNPRSWPSLLVRALSPCPGHRPTWKPSTTRAHQTASSQAVQRRIPEIASNSGRSELPANTGDFLWRGRIPEHFP